MVEKIINIIPDLKKEPSIDLLEKITIEENIPLALFEVRNKKILIQIDEKILIFDF